MRIVVGMLILFPQLLFAQTDSNTVDSASEKKKVYTVVEEMPRFVGGEEALMMYISHNIRYPAEARNNGVTGKVYLSFIVNDSGKVRDVKVLKGIGSGCDEEAMRVIKQMPDWEPGRQNGEPVSVYYNVPISFNLSKGPPANYSGNSSSRSNLRNRPLSYHTYNDGVTYLKAGKYELARKKFEEALKGAQEGLGDIDALFNLGVTRFYLGDTSGACWLWRGAMGYRDEESGKYYEKYCSACKDSLEGNSTLSLARIKMIQSNTKESGKLVLPRIKFSDGKLKNYLYENVSFLKSKDKNNKYDFTVTFLVASDGSIMDPEITKGSTNGNDEEIISVFKKMVKWIPGVYDFCPVGMYQEIELRN